jgi:hypothetical protein
MKIALASLMLLLTAAGAHAHVPVVPNPDHESPPAGGQTCEP